MIADRLTSAKWPASAAGRARACGSVAITSTTPPAILELPAVQSRPAHAGRARRHGARVLCAWRRRAPASHSEAASGLMVVPDPERPATIKAPARWLLLYRQLLRALQLGQPHYNCRIKTTASWRPNAPNLRLKPTTLATPTMATATTEREAPVVPMGLCVPSCVRGRNLTMRFPAHDGVTCQTVGPWTT